jgi:hypothetical protein
MIALPRERSRRVVSMTEVWLGRHLASFDGRVLEVWGPTKANGRLHIAAIRDVVIEPAKRDELCIDFQTIWGAGNLLLKFPAAQRATAEQFALVVRQARPPQAAPAGK